MNQINIDQFSLSYYETYRLLRMFMVLWSRNGLLIPEMTEKCLDDMWSLSSNIFVDDQLQKDIEKLQEKFSNNDRLSKQKEFVAEWAEG